MIRKIFFAMISIDTSPLFWAFQEKKRLKTVIYKKINFVDKKYVNFKKNIKNKHNNNLKLVLKDSVEINIIN
jgi:S-adenosylmethionine hydrolase